MSLRIGLNATCFSERPSGANQRFRHLLGALIRQRPDWHFIIYEPHDVRVAAAFADCPNVEPRITPLPAEGRGARLLAGLGYWRRALRADRLDLFECFHLPAVIAPDCPTLLTIHDLRPVHANAGWVSRRIASPVLHHALTRTHLTLAVSDTVAAELRAFHPGARVRRLYNGVHPEDFVRPDAAACAAARARWDLPERFVLSVGHLEERKNLTQAIEAIALLREQGRDLPLLLVGNPGESENAIAAKIVLHGLTASVRLLHGVGNDDLGAMYHLADLLVFPSAYEGFGIPLIEAMATGLPIAASDTPVFRELAQGAARFFPLGDPAATAAAIAALWDDPAERAALVAAGRERLARHDFAVLAEELAAIYCEATGR
jgi:glycosyltransferase involved in cell wall biosynthesis